LLFPGLEPLPRPRIFKPLHLQIPFLTNFHSSKMVTRNLDELPLENKSG